MYTFEDLAVHHITTPMVLKSCPMFSAERLPQMRHADVAHVQWRYFLPQTEKKNLIDPTMGTFARLH